MKLPVSPSLPRTPRSRQKSVPSSRSINRARLAKYRIRARLPSRTRVINQPNKTSLPMARVNWLRTRTRTSRIGFARIRSPRSIASPSADAGRGIGVAAVSAAGTGATAADTMAADIMIATVPSTTSPSTSPTTTASPAVVAAPVTNFTPVVGACQVTVVNPATNKAALSLVVGSQTYTLQAGESKVVDTTSGNELQFDRGNGDTVRYTLSEGTYSFGATPTGWELYHGNPTTTATAATVVTTLFADDAIVSE